MPYNKRRLINRINFKLWALTQIAPEALVFDPNKTYDDMLNTSEAFGSRLCGVSLHFDTPLVTSNMLRDEVARLREEFEAKVDQLNTVRQELSREITFRFWRMKYVNGAWERIFIDNTKYYGGELTAEMVNPESELLRVMAEALLNTKSAETQIVLICDPDGRGYTVRGSRVKGVPATFRLPEHYNFSGGIVSIFER